MKKFVMGFLTAALLFTAIPVGAAIEEYICHKADYKVMVNGTEYVSEDLPVLNYKGSTYAPFRSVLEAAGLNVNWNAELKQAEVTAPKGNLMNGGDNVSETEVPTNKYGLPDFSNYKEKPSIETIDGNVFFTYNDKKYINIIGLRNDKKILPDGYGFWCPVVNGKVSTIVQLTKAPDYTDVLIDEVPYALYADERDFFVLYDYYLNTILPLVK